MEKNIISIRECDGSIITLEAHKRLDSTQELARQYAKDKCPDRYVVFAEERTLDDGNVERGMYVSIILRPSFFPSQASLMGILSGVAIHEALREHTSKRLGLGWVSDVYCEGERIGAATIEGKLDNYTTYEYLIVTFSVRLREADFPPRLTDLVSEVFERGKSSISMIIARNAINKFFSFYSNLKNPAKFMDIYNEVFALKGVKVKYHTGEKKKSCKVVGVNEKNGVLILEMKKGEEIAVSSPSLVTIPKRIPLKKDKRKA